MTIQFLQAPLYNFVEVYIELEHQHSFCWTRLILHFYLQLVKLNANWNGLLGKNQENCKERKIFYRNVECIRIQTLGKLCQNFLFDYTQNTDHHHLINTELHIHRTVSLRWKKWEFISVELQEKRQRIIPISSAFPDFPIHSPVFSI